jgi:hypothetical protein
MLNVRNLLIVLLCASPLFLAWNGPIAGALIAGVAAIALALTSLGLRPGETEFLVSVTRLPLIASALPALWMLFQVLPLGLFAHPIWKSTASTLHQPMLGSISIDPATSLASLAAYLSLVAVGFVSAAVAVDRNRAETLLIALTFAATVTGLFIIAQHPFPLASWLPDFNWKGAIECISLGTIAAAANLMRTVERYMTRKQRQARLKNIRALFASFVALVVCLIAVALSATATILFATGYGLLMLTLPFMIHHFALRAWGIIMLAVPALAIAAILVGAYFPQRDVSLPLAFAGGSSPLVVELDQRMLNDTPFVGAGAGTFSALSSIYREKEDLHLTKAPATTAAGIAIEYGQQALWLIITAAIAGAFIFMRYALHRGRDSFYSAMAGSTLLTIVLLAFGDAGLLSEASGVLVAAILGIGIAQTKGRTASF